MTIAADSSPSPARHWPALDGLRGLAILLVLPHNLLPTVDASNWWFRLVGAWCERGWIGVQLFFVLSGFLITGILLDTKRCRHGLAVFFVRRVLRIFPLYYAVLLLMLVVWPLLSSALALAPPAQVAHPLVLRSYWLYLSNWVAPLHPGGGQLPHLWSLAVEEQFYLVWPLLVWWLQPRAVLLLSLGVALASLGLRMLLWSQGQANEVLYQFTICRVDALALGAAVAAALRVPVLAAALRARPTLWGLAGLVVFVVGAALTHGWQAFDLGAQTAGYTVLALACALLVLLLVLTDEAPSGARGLVARWLAHPWLRRAGRYSYGMYLLHVPVAAVLAALAASQSSDRWAWLGQVPMSPASALLHVGVIGAITLGLAALSYHGFEAFFLRLKPPYQAPG